ncbi:MAG TPA: sodium:solute symporter family protein [Chitinophagales bacterium]|nr:sodium:solute symporter family protein [Chitinophagales bacterium]HMZ88655.1 sodium:solute symporter family protein [Chitinophagales bacterium]HNE46112.1 sodium:solute symporter family protein [Chitinophagales bacterium]HNF70144.1 sodium:solute symporter family protein [Chitinophagales bacterium]HNI53906.1 sodium:solute symporter family protein [Chitinophagales bacterium]
MLLTFVIIYMVATIAIGVLASRLVKGSGDFVQAGRRLPPFFNAAALFALWFGSETVFGASSAFLEGGLLNVIEDPFGASLCLFLFGFFFVRKLYRMNLLTIGDLFRIKYGQNVELISSFFMLLTFFGYIAAQYVALGIILQVVLLQTGINMSLPTAIILCSIIVTAYTMIGGMWAVSITDFIQSILIVIGLIIVVIFVANEAGGVSQVIANAPENTFKFLPNAEPIDITNWIGAWMVIGLGYIPSQDVFQRANSARSEKAAVNSTYLGAIMYLLIAMLPLFIALAARVLYPDQDFSDSQSVLPHIVLDHTPLWIQILFFGSLLSAVLSTCSGSLLAPASILAENFIKPLYKSNGKREMTDRKFLIVLRLSVVAIAFISFLITLPRQNIYELVGESATFGMVSLLAPMTAGLYWKNINTQGALLSMFGGLVVYVFFQYFYPISIEAFIPATIVSFICMYAGRFIDEKKSPRYASTLANRFTKFFKD